MDRPLDNFFYVAVTGFLRRFESRRRNGFGDSFDKNLQADFLTEMGRRKDSRSEGKFSLGSYLVGNSYLSYFLRRK